MHGWPNTNHSLIRRDIIPPDQNAARKLQAIDHPVILNSAPYPFSPVAVSGVFS